MAGNYNRNTYNSALYNAGRDDAGALIRSIISAHTGRHIQASVGGDPSGSPETSDGLAFISDFSILEGTVKRPPASFFFPDLAARIDAVRSQVDNIAAIIRGQAFKDLPSCIYLVAFQPDLPASLFGLAQKDLGAFLLGLLAEKDLGADIFVAVDNLGGIINELLEGETTPFAPRLRATINRDFPPGFALAPSLGAIIWTPLDLKAVIGVVEFGDLPADIFAFQARDLPARVFSQFAPSIRAFLRGFASQTADLPGAVRLSAEVPDLPAEINPSFGGETGFRVGLEAQIDSSGGYDSFIAAITPSIPDIGDLLAFIQTGGEQDLAAVIELLGADNLTAVISTLAFDDTVAELLGFAQPVTPVDLGANMEINQNAKLLAATITALRDSADMSAFIRVAETFVTAVYNIITFGARDLRATIGNPECQGGSGSVNLEAYARAQAAGDISAWIQSFIENNLGAVINTNNRFRTIDYIDVSYSKKRNRPRKFLATDTIPVTYSPFRGASLGAAITATPPEVTLPATITATFLPPRVAPNVSLLTNAELRFGEEFNTQEIRLQLEGTLLEYFYVNDSQNAFIKDPNEDWKINIRAFQPIAENLFGEFAAARVCRLGDLRSFSTIDEAVRFCISAVIGLEGQRDFGATINVRGGINNLSAFAGVSNIFDDLGGIANRVFPADFPAAISGVPIGIEGLQGILLTTAPGTVNIPAAISGFDQTDLGVEFVLNPNAKLLNAFIETSERLDLPASITALQAVFSIRLDGVDEYVEGPILGDIDAPGSFGNQITVGFWFRNDKPFANIPTFYSLCGSTSDWFQFDDGFGFYLNSGASLTFFINNFGVGGTNVTANFGSTNQWVHVVGVYDGTLGTDTLKLYINGDLAAENNSSYSTNLNGLTTTFELGKLGNTNHPVDRFFAGSFDDVAIWEGALQADEVAELFNNSRGRVPLDQDGESYSSKDILRLWWSFEDSPFLFPTIQDFAGNGNEGTAINMETTDQVAFTPAENAVSMEFEYPNTNTYFRTTDTSFLTGSGSFSCMVSFKLDESALISDFFIPVGAWDENDFSFNEPPFRFKRNSNTFGNDFNFSVKNTAGTAVFAANGESILGSQDRWLNFIGTYDADTGDVAIYQNGDLKGTNTLGGIRADWQGASPEFTIGAGRFANNTVDIWEGLIDTVAVWDKSLDAGEVEEAVGRFGETPEASTIFAFEDTEFTTSSPHTTYNTVLTSSNTVSGVTYLLLYSATAGGVSNSVQVQARIRLGTTEIGTARSRCAGSGSNPEERVNGVQLQGFTIIEGDGNAFSIQVRNPTNNSSVNMDSASIIAVPLIDALNGTDYFFDVSNDSTIQLENAATAFVGGFTNVVSSSNFNFSSLGDYILLTSVEADIPGGIAGEAAQARFIQEGAILEPGTMKGTLVSTQQRKVNFVNIDRFNVGSPGFQNFQIQGASLNSSVVDFSRGRTIAIREGVFKSFLEEVRALGASFNDSDPVPAFASPLELTDNPVEDVTHIVLGWVIMSAGDVSQRTPLVQLNETNSGDTFRKSTGQTYGNAGTNNLACLNFDCYRPSADHDLHPTLLLHAENVIGGTAKNYRLLFESAATAGGLAYVAVGFGPNGTNEESKLWVLQTGGVAAREVDLSRISTSENLKVWYRLGEAGDSESTIKDKSGNGGPDLTRTGGTRTNIVRDVPPLPPDTT